MNYIKTHKAFLGTVIFLIALIGVQIYLSYSLYTIKTQLGNIDKNFEGAVIAVVGQMVNEAQQAQTQ